MKTIMDRVPGTALAYTLRFCEISLDGIQSTLNSSLRLAPPLRSGPRQGLRQDLRRIASDPYGWATLIFPQA